MKTIKLLRWTPALVLGITYSFGIANAAVTDEPLVQQSDLVYQGAFRVPQLGQSADANSYNYGGTSLGHNPANNSLYIVGYDPQQYLGEISIPEIRNSASISSLATATELQPLKDPTEGKLNSINPPDTNAHNIGGTLVYDNNLYLTGFSFYDGAGTQSTSHFVRPLNLSTTGQVKGPFLVGTDPHFVNGYMTQIPSEWQSLFGGPALTGKCCLAIVSQQSNGPAASVFNPSNVGVLNPVPATPIVGYPIDHPLGPGWGTTNNLFNGTTNITGIIFPLGTRSVLFFGRHGVGTWCYGPGADCNDPADSSKGTHAYPYKHQVWAYDANDLLAVKNGTKQQWEIQPYAVWILALPFDNTGGMMQIGGAAYDSATGRIYISQLLADTLNTPIIHVFKVNIGTAPPADTTPPSTPSRLRIR